MVEYNNNNIILHKIKKQGVKTVDNGKITAVHDDDLVDFLKSIEEYDKIINGLAVCSFCGKVMTLDNIQSIFPLDNEVKYCCNAKECARLLI